MRFQRPAFEQLKYAEAVVVSKQGKATVLQLERAEMRDTDSERFDPFAIQNDQIRMAFLCWRFDVTLEISQGILLGETYPGFSHVRFSVWSWRLWGRGDEFDVSDLQQPGLLLQKGLGFSLLTV